MDWVKLREKIRIFGKKYRYAIGILVLGLVLMCLPDMSKEEDTPEPEPETQQLTVEQRLESILGQIDGVGQVRILLTERTGEEYHYQSDEDSSTGTDTASTRRDTVVITDSDRTQQGLVSRVDPPQYWGAVVVCQGGDRASVRLAVVQAVSNVTGLGADKITVLKMK